MAGRHKSDQPHGWDCPVQEIYLKKLLADANISQREFGPMIGVSGGTINLLCNKSYIPRSMPGFKQQLEKFVSEHAGMMAVLKREKRDVKSIWEPLEGCHMNKIKPASNGVNKPAAIVPGNQDETETKEVTMLSLGARKQFGMFNNQFLVRSDRDVYMSDEHRYIEAAMIDAARNGGFMAVIGQVGSGKTEIRKKVRRQLCADGDVLIIFPRIIDKKRVTAASLCEAIISDISRETPRLTLEAKARQVERLIIEQAEQGVRHVLMIEEAHDLSVPALKYLKRFHELEDEAGFRKLLGIILIAQPELKEMFLPQKNVDLREVTQRLQVAEIAGLNGSLKAYLAVKFNSVGVKLEKVFTDDAYAAISSRFQKPDDSGRQISTAYPLVINDFVMRAMNLAHEMGEPLVSADVIRSL